MAPIAAIDPRDLEACRALLAEGSKSFALAARLLPRRIRREATALYAFLRVADDAIDATENPKAGLSEIRHRIVRLYAGDPWPHPADRALAAVIRDHGLPREALEGLAEGFAWDAEGRRYANFDVLMAYCVRVAGTVGVLMAHLLGIRDGAALARAIDLGVAMQLTNIARDIGEDAQKGRIYLPEAWLSTSGLDADAWLARPRATPELAALTDRLLGEADRLYARAEQGIAHLPPECRPAIRAARLIYAAIGREVTRLGTEAISARAHVRLLRKLMLLARAQFPLPGEALDGHALHPPPLCAAQFLLAHVHSDPAFRRLPQHSPPWWDFSGRLLAILPILEKLERAERVAAHPVGWRVDWAR